MLKVINKAIAVGSDAQPEALQALAQEGYQGLIDLCTPPENNQIDPAVAQNAGLAHTAVPISPKNLNGETLAAFKNALDTAPQPVYVRCASGLRAGVFTLLALAEQEGWSEAEYQAQFQALGIDQKADCPLGAFAHERFAK